MVKKLEGIEYDAFRERVVHGETVFPFSIYSCRIPELFSEVSMHWHEEMEIIYIRRGRGTVTVDLESRTLQAPAIVFILPGQMHSIRQYKMEEMEYSNLIFDTKLLSSGGRPLFEQQYLEPLFGGMIDVPPFLTEDMERFDELETLIGSFNAAEEHKNGYPLLFMSRLYQLCYQLEEYYPRRDGASASREDLVRMKRVLNYVHENYSEPIYISDAAQEVDISEGHFMRFFKEMMGITFVSYLKDYRLTRAEEMLRSTDLSILDIAMENGFPNVSYFIRAFKGKYHKTPLKYRQ